MCRLFKLDPYTHSNPQDKYTQPSCCCLCAREYVLLRRGNLRGKSSPHAMLGLSGLVQNRSQFSQRPTAIAREPSRELCNIFHHCKNALEHNFCRVFFTVCVYLLYSYLRALTFTSKSYALCFNESRDCGRILANTPCWCTNHIYIYTAFYLSAKSGSIIIGGATLCDTQTYNHQLANPRLSYGIAPPKARIKYTNWVSVPRGGQAYSIYSIFFFILQKNVGCHACLRVYIYIYCKVYMCVYSAICQIRLLDAVRSYVIPILVDATK